MGVDALVLSKAVREPMRRWWTARGSWFLVGIASLLAVNAIVSFTVYQWGANQLNWVTFIWGWAYGLAPLLLTITWIMAMQHCCRIAREFLSEHAVPDAHRFAPLVFSLAYRQGVRAAAGYALVVFLTAWASFYFRPNYPYNYNVTLDNFLLDFLYRELVEALFTVVPIAITLIWLTALQVLLPKLRWPVWVLWGAGFAGSVLLGLYYLLVQGIQDTPVRVLSTYWGALFGAGIVLGMFVAFQAGARRWGWWLFWTIAVLNLQALTLLDGIPTRLGLGWLPLTTLHAWFGSFYGGVPLPVWPGLELVKEKFPPEATALPFLAALAGIVVYVGYVWLLYSLMQRIILSPYMAQVLNRDGLAREEDG